LRDAEKTVQVDTSNKDLKGDNLGSSFKASSGLAFVELATAEAALFTVRYLNNMQFTSRGLIVDFCLQDARKIFRRTMKLEKHQRLAMERKDAIKKERRNEKRANINNVGKNDTVELGKRTGPAVVRKPTTVKDVDDVEKLAKMKEESISRGKKQRINKKIALITGKGTEIIEQVKATKVNKQDAKKKVDLMLKKRDAKMVEKSQNKKTIHTPEDKEIMKI